MGDKYTVTVGDKTYMVDLTGADGKWTGAVIPISGSLAYRPVWTTTATSETDLKKQIDRHLNELRAE